ncbi:ABC transporter permease [Nocardia grenadensis]|uniref:ABC transporter permease n=1 Tax=Nocardia grenadensis TaxID=931537 RepID=UPI003D766416
MTVLRRLAWELWFPLLLIALWWIISASSIDPYFPPLSEILDEFVDVWFFEGIRTEIWPSLQRLILAFAIACCAGVGLGLVLGVMTRLDNAVRPIVEFLRATPGVAILPVMILLLGLSDSMKIAIIALVATWPILLNTIDGVRSVEPVLHQVTASYRITLADRIKFVILPAASPQIFAGARTALSIAVVAMVIAEMVGTPGGIGYYILDAQRGFKITSMWAGIIALGILGYLLNKLFALGERRALAWHAGMTAYDRGGK